MVRQLRQNLAKCMKVVVDNTMDLRTRERWTQLYNNSSQVAQPGVERQTDARLGEKTSRDRRVREEPLESGAISSRPQRIKGSRHRGVVISRTRQPILVPEFVGKA